MWYHNQCAVNLFIGNHMPGPKLKIESTISPLMVASENKENKAKKP